MKITKRQSKYIKQFAYTLAVVSGIAFISWHLVVPLIFMPIWVIFILWPYLFACFYYFTKTSSKLVRISGSNKPYLHGMIITLAGIILSICFVEYGISPVLFTALVVSAVIIPKLSNWLPISDIKLHEKALKNSVRNFRKNMKLFLSDGSNKILFAIGIMILAYLLVEAVGYVDLKVDEHRFCVTKQTFKELYGYFKDIDKNARYEEQCRSDMGKFSRHIPRECTFSIVLSKKYEHMYQGIIHQTNDYIIGTQDIAKDGLWRGVTFDVDNKRTFGETCRYSIPSSADQNIIFGCDIPAKQFYVKNIETPSK